jgi:hypothetical protein
MNKTLRLLTAFWLLLFSAAFAKAADDGADYGTPAGTIVVPAGLTAAEVQRCLLEAAAGRGWTIRKRDDEKVVIYLENKRWVANLTLVYNTEQVQIYSKSLRSGKPKVPEDWIEFLKKDANVKLNTLAISKG